MTGSNESLEFYKAAYEELIARIKIALARLDAVRKAALNDGREVGPIYVLRLVDRLENDLKEMTNE